MGNCDKQIRDSIVPTADSNYVDRNGILTIHRSGFDLNQTIGYTNRNWMANIPNSRRISELSIPGTHGSMALYGGILHPQPIIDLTINQTMNLTTQLNSGIRFIDIRCRHRDNAFAIHHGQVFQRAYFVPDVLMPVTRFLEENPNETILMYIQEEYTPTGNTRSFAETFESIWTQYQNHFWNPTNDNPTLNEVRGKIILLQAFPATRGWFGINWGLLVKQNRWEIHGPNDIYNKWIDVRTHFFNAMNNRNRIHVNFLSGTGAGNISGPSPWFLASGYNNRKNNSLLRSASSGPATGWPDFPRYHATAGPVFFGGMNLLSTRRILDRRITHTGIVVADFPGRGLIDGTIALNFPEDVIGDFKIVTSLNNRSLVDLNLGGNSIVHLWDDVNQRNAQWEFIYSHQRNAYIIRNLFNRNLVLSMDAPRINDVFAYPFHSDDAQFWILESNQDGYIFRSLRNRNLVLDVSGGNPNPQNGTRIIVFPFQNSNNQRFRLQSL
ncbi:phosphatidylinositol-specific phospholipase C domain-containing protein [Bacillus mycoides]|uniref:phosphatidylinositol-specific phospholipase C domain-containing protein n=1 Tax=Bacillus mycoides TaxID=1405 RepID=UPI003D03711A